MRSHIFDWLFRYLYTLINSMRSRNDARRVIKNTNKVPFFRSTFSDVSSLNTIYISKSCVKCLVTQSTHYIYLHLHNNQKCSLCSLFCRLISLFFFYIFALSGYAETRISEEIKWLNGLQMHYSTSKSKSYEI